MGNNSLQSPMQISIPLSLIQGLSFQKWTTSRVAIFTKTKYPKKAIRPNRAKTSKNPKTATRKLKTLKNIIPIIDRKPKSK